MNVRKWRDFGVVDLCVYRFFKKRLLSETV